MWVVAGCSKTPNDAAKTRAGTDTEEYHQLLELASSEGGSQSFKALLKLREFSDERGIPVLETILKRHTGTGNIFGFGAAQALFCIGSTRAHAILERHLLTPEYLLRWESDTRFIGGCLRLSGMPS